MQEQLTDFKLCWVVTYINNFQVAVTFSTTQSSVAVQHEQTMSLLHCISLTIQLQRMKEQVPRDLTELSKSLLIIAVRCLADTLILPLAVHRRC